MKPLADCQERFFEYTFDQNATAAAGRAGYSDKTPRYPDDETPRYVSPSWWCRGAWSRGITRRSTGIIGRGRRSGRVETYPD
ncbi:MAG: hypothetical protein JWN73_4314 [Betaproteobacteria bacterium]|nr:hypothetical protein [Betaproteobacteria bacterium]